MKAFITGYAHHGKDTLAEVFKEVYKLSFMSSSMFCLYKCILPYHRAQKCTIKHTQEFLNSKFKDDKDMFDKRKHHRRAWHEIIKNYNGQDLARLSREIFKIYNLYVGIRNIDEYNAYIKEYPNTINIWVYNENQPVEERTSNTMTPDHADIIIYNNGSIEDLKRKVIRLYSNNS